MNLITANSQRTYGDKVCRLLFNVIRHMSPGWTSRVPYPPLDPTQIAVLQNLLHALHEEDQKAIDLAFHDACYVLYAHERHQYLVSEERDQFFSSVNIFLVYLSFSANGNFQVPSTITGHCAALEYSIRSVILVEVDTIARTRHVSAFKYVILYFFIMLPF